MTTAVAVPTITLERLIYSQLDANTLIEWAWRKRQEDPRVRARQALTPEGVDRLAEIISAGSVPTVGFFRRWSA